MHEKDIQVMVEGPGHVPLNEVAPNVGAITRFPNPLTEGRGLPINSMSVITELFEIAFVILTAIIVIKERWMLAQKSH